MKRVFTGGTCAAVALAWSVVVSAQAGQPASQPPTPSPAAASQEQKAAAQQVTIVGCVQKEADYRRAQNMRGGGVAGTGVGAANEFVLINAATSTPAGATDAPVGTSGTTAGTDAFELTGSGETKAEPFVGKRVEITGTLKAAETGPAGATGGPTAAKPPAGVDVASADLKLRELEVVSVRETTGTCPAAR
jgi:hypothetical protein